MKSLKIGHPRKLDPTKISRYTVFFQLPTLILFFLLLTVASYHVELSTHYGNKPSTPEAKRFACGFSTYPHPTQVTMLL